MKTLAISAFSLLSSAGIAMADTPPPANSLPLSEVIAMIEATNDVRYFDEVEWDDDGYWEVEFVRADGAEVSIKLDPLTGAPR